MDSSLKAVLNSFYYLSQPNHAHCMEAFSLFHEYVKRLVWAIEKSECDIKDQLPYIGDIDSLNQKDHFSVKTKGGSVLFDVFNTPNYIEVDFFHLSEKTKTETAYGNEIAHFIIEFLEKKYMCVLDVPGFPTFSQKPDYIYNLPFRCMSWTEAIDAFRASTQGRTEDITEKMTKINEGITQKLDDIDKQKETLENAKAKISAFTTSSTELMDTLRALDGKLSRM